MRGSRQTLSHMFDRAASACGVLACLEQGMAAGVTILMYHRVLPDAQAARYPLPALAMPRTAFEAQVRRLSHHSQLLTLSQAVSWIRSGKPHPERPIVCITFDDGYHDNFDIAASILNQVQARATFFVTSGFVGNKVMLWFDRIALAWLRDGGVSSRRTCRLHASPPPATLDRLLILVESLTHQQREQLLTELGEVENAFHPTVFEGMTPVQLRQLAAEGHEIGAHTVTHPILSSMPLAAALDEAIRSKVELEHIIGKPVTGFAYPGGACSDELARGLNAAGFNYACTMVPGRNSSGGQLMRLKRLDMKPRLVTNAGAHDDLAFRGELSLLRPTLRKALRTVLRAPS